MSLVKALDEAASGERAKPAYLRHSRTLPLSAPHTPPLLPVSPEERLSISPLARACSARFSSSPTELQDDSEQAVQVWEGRKGREREGVGRRWRFLGGRGTHLKNQDWSEVDGMGRASGWTS